MADKQECPIPSFTTQQMAMIALRMALPSIIKKLKEKKPMYIQGSYLKKRYVEKALEETLDKNPNFGIARRIVNSTPYKRDASNSLPYEKLAIKIRDAI